MNRKILGGAIALVVVVVGVWFLWLRGGGDDTDHGDDHGRSGAIAKGSHRNAQPAPGRSGQIQWALDVDPEGPLRMEGQVLGPDDRGVGGATVWLASVPPRKYKTDDDGSFHFDKLVSRTYSLTASSAPDLISGTVVYKLTPTSDPVIVRVAQGAGIEVTVIDDAKTPITGAEVRAAESQSGSSTPARTQGVKPRIGGS